ncbi:MAG: hypothetical protein OXI87_21365 [Albidovulum sp.]|nr:hypothetical protein [Albidovulum sp.]
MAIDDETMDDRDKESQVLYLSSNFSIYPLFSRGCLYPPALELGDEYEFPAPHADRFVGFVPSLPETIVKNFQKSARNLFPIAIATKSKYHREIESTRITIPLSDVQQLIFRNEQELKLFELSPYMDVDMPSIAVTRAIDASVFKGTISKPTEELPPNSNLLEQSLIRTAFRKANTYGGFLCGLMFSMPGKRMWFDFFNNASSATPQAPPDADLKEMSVLAQICFDLAVPVRRECWEEAVLDIAARQLLDLEISEGWPAKCILSDVTNKSIDLLSDRGLESAKKQLNGWVDRSSRVLDDEAPLPPLNDDGSIVLRALLLLLVRKSTESLLKLRPSHGAGRVGEKVWRLSFALASFHEGLRVLPSKLKFFGSPEQARARMEFLGEAVEHCIKYSIDKQLVRSSGAVSMEEFVDSGRNQLGISWNGVRILSRPLEVSPALEKAASDCRYYGFEVGKVGDEFFEVSSGVDVQLDTNVQVSVLHDAASGSELLRFKAIAISLATTRSTRPEKPLKALVKSRRLKKESLISMLISNAEESQNCRVAIQTDPLAVVVIVDQMLDTMDREECVAHLRNVSTRAKSLLTSP